MRIGRTIPRRSVSSTLKLLLLHLALHGPHVHQAQGQPPWDTLPSFSLLGVEKQKGLEVGSLLFSPSPISAQDSLRGYRPTLQQEEPGLDRKKNFPCVKDGHFQVVVLHLSPQAQVYENSMIFQGDLRAS
jgi:hypothetical protein